MSIDINDLIDRLQHTEFVCRAETALALVAFERDIQSLLEDARSGHRNPYLEDIANRSLNLLRSLVINDDLANMIRGDVLAHFAERNSTVEVA